MKKILYMIYGLMLGLLLAAPAFADQRIETEQNLCHFAYDPADDDNEVYYGNCANQIDTYDAGDGNGRLAYSQAIKTVEYRLREGDKPPIPLGAGFIKLKGSASTMDGYTVSNTSCEAVTSNYDANAGANNYTTYTTNDWLLDMRWASFDPESFSGTVEYHLRCYNGTA